MIQVIDKSSIIVSNIVFCVYQLMQYSFMKSYINIPALP